MSLASLTAYAKPPQPIAPEIAFTPATLHSGSPILFRLLPGVRPARAVTATWLKHTLTFTPSPDKSYWFALAGVDVEQAPGTYPIDLTETLADGTALHLAREIKIAPAHYRTATLDVAPNFVAPDQPTLDRIAAEQAIKTAAFDRNTPQPLWSGPFAKPVPFAPTDSFGTRRTFNGTLASIHKGADFHAPAGTPVYAANDGIVALAQPMFYEGNLVALDHGQQLFSLYMHLSRIDVHPGDRVRKGQRLGLSGATGRVTGPHLHLGIRWQGAYLDPALLLNLPLPTQR